MNYASAKHQVRGWQKRDMKCWVVKCGIFDRSELLILRWSDPLYTPGALLVTHCNLWCWEITGAGRPGRHGQLGESPPVRRGQCLTPNFSTKLGAFHSVFKGFHIFVSDDASQLLKSTKAGEKVWTWGRWTEHPAFCTPSAPPGQDHVQLIIM